MTPLQRYSGDVITAHCYAVHGSILPTLVGFLESILDRPPGHSDGAFSFFRSRHPDVVTLVALPTLASQRPSRSDLTPQWFDRVPGLREAAALWRRFKS